MNFIQVVISTVIICAIQNVNGDAWSDSRETYIWILNRFFQPYFNAYKESCYHQNPSLTLQYIPINENLRESKIKIQNAAKDIMNGIRNQFSITPNAYMYLNSITQRDPNFIRRVRAVIKNYCKEVRENGGIDETLKGKNILLKKYLTEEIYKIDLGCQNPAKTFKEDCYPTTTTDTNFDPYINPPTLESASGPYYYEDQPYHQFI